MGVARLYRLRRILSRVANNGESKTPHNKDKEKNMEKITDKRHKALIIYTALFKGKKSSALNQNEREVINDLLKKFDTDTENMIELIDLITTEKNERN